MKANRLASAVALSLAAFSASAAQYQVVELPFQELGNNNFVSTINEQGVVVSSVQDPFNPPIDLTLIDFDSESVQNALTDVEAAREGNFNTQDYTFLFNTIRAAEGSVLVQQLAEFQSYTSDGTDLNFVTGFDEIDADLGTYTGSTETQVLKFKHGAIVGISQDPFYKLSYTNESDEEIVYVVSDFDTRGFIQQGDIVKPLTPPDTTLGGKSEAFDINANMQVAGVGTVEALEATTEAEAQCEDPEQRGDQPVEACKRILMNGGLLENGFRRRGLIWQLDNNGDIISTRELGLLLTPEEDDTRNFSSRAVAINDAGIAVGDSSDFQPNNVVSTHAAIYTDNEVIGFIDKDTYFSSVASGINNNNKVTGVGFTNVNGATRTKFYVHDIDSGETVFPEDFFPGSSSLARDINDNNLVVGEGEVENDIDQVRRRNAFLYDIDSEVFTNVNDLLTCDSPYTIVEALDINDNNEIAANAIIRSATRNVDGTELVDDAGNPVLEDRVVAVKLIPIPGGQIEDCSATEERLERQGASNSLFAIGALLLAGLFRRRIRR